MFIFPLVFFFSDVTQTTSEVLLEVFDRFNNSQRFLGLALVGIEELLPNPSQRQIIPLQARPYEQDEVTGTLTVEVWYQFSIQNLMTKLDYCLLLLLW